MLMEEENVSNFINCSPKTSKVKQSEYIKITPGYANRWPIFSRFDTMSSKITKKLLLYVLPDKIHAISSS